MQSLSVVLATYNEEENLAECLESVKDLASEIVVIDGSSQDKTVDIAKKFGAKVTITTNKPMFHTNKQMGIDLAKKDWILQLDADERVSPQLKEEITNVLKEDDKEYNGYWIPRKNFFLGRFLMKGGVFPDYMLRLYRKGKGKLPQLDVHEQAVVEGKSGYLRHPLIHIADPKFSRYLLRWNRYTDLIAKEIGAKTPSVFAAPIYLVFKPVQAFLWTYGRHKGFMDGWQGLVFHSFSALRFPAGYIKFLKKNGRKN